jgi:hypothetical protein
LLEEPCLRDFPVTHDGLWRDLENFCGLVDAQTAEKAQLHHAASSWIRTSQRLERVVQRQHVHVGRSGDCEVGIQCDACQFAAAFQRLAGAGGINKDAAHRLCRYGEKVGPVLPLDATGIHEPQVRLVDELAGLQRVVGTLSAKLTMGQPTELAVNEGDQFLERRLIALSPGKQQLGDVVTCQFFSALSALLVDGRDVPGQTPRERSLPRRLLIRRM